MRVDDDVAGESAIEMGRENVPAVFILSDREPAGRAAGRATSP